MLIIKVRIWLWWLIYRAHHQGEDLALMAHIPGLSSGWGSGSDGSCTRLIIRVRIWLWWLIYHACSSSGWGSGSDGSSTGLIIRVRIWLWWLIYRAQHQGEDLALMAHLPGLSSGWGSGSDGSCSRLSWVFWPWHVQLPLILTTGRNRVWYFLGLFCSLQKFRRRLFWT